MASPIVRRPSSANSMPPPPRRQSTTTLSLSQTSSLGGTQTTTSSEDTTEDSAEADSSSNKYKTNRDLMSLDQTLQSLVGASEFEDDDSLPDDLEQKIHELQASGWRPPEETLDTPDDDDYDEVNMLSDNEEEEEEPSLLIREAQLLAAEERLHAADEQALARRLSLSSQGSNDSDVAYLEFNDNFLFTSETPWSQSFQHLHPDNLVDYATVFADDANTDAPAVEDTPLGQKVSEDAFGGAQRRVRFEDEVDDSDTDSSDDDDEEEMDQDYYPDLFIQQDSLDAGFRADVETEINYDMYMDDESDTGSCWDFDADEARSLAIDLCDNSDSDSSSAGSSGYESDDGDTTDEEEVELPPEKIRQTPENPIASKPQVPKPIVSNIARRVIKRQPKLTEPRRGEFKLDPTKAVLTIDVERRVIWPAKKPTGQDQAFWRQYHLIHSTNNSQVGSRNTSPRMSIGMTPTDESDSNMPSRQLSIDSSNMADDFFDVNGRLRSDQILGPMEAFMPFMDADTSEAIFFKSAPQSSFQAIPGAEEEEEDEQDPLNSFFDFGDDEDEDMPDESDTLVSPSASQSFPSAASTGGFDLLAHLDRRRGMVGSFRRNQQIARHVGSLPSHPALRASASETNAMQHGRRAAANTPITPLRKKKMGKGVGARNSPIVSPVKSSKTKRKGPAKGGFSR